MPIVRRTRADLDKAELLTELAARRPPTEQEIEAQAAEDGDAWSDAEVAEAEAAYPPPSPEQVRAVRTRLGLSQARFARLLGLDRDAIQKYEQGHRQPSGPEAKLFRLIVADPDAVMRALTPRKAS
jgi:putative transcriptional regulator